MTIFKRIITKIKNFITRMVSWFKKAFWGSKRTDDSYNRAFIDQVIYHDADSGYEVYENFGNLFDDYNEDKEDITPTTIDTTLNNDNIKALRYYLKKKNDKIVIMVNTTVDIVPSTVLSRIEPDPNMQVYHVGDYVGLIINLKTVLGSMSVLTSALHDKLPLEQQKTQYPLNQFLYCTKYKKFEPTIIYRQNYNNTDMVVVVKSKSMNTDYIITTKVDFTITGTMLVKGRIRKVSTLLTALIPYDDDMLLVGSPATVCKLPLIIVQTIPTTTHGYIYIILSTLHCYDSKYEIMSFDLSS